MARRAAQQKDKSEHSSSTGKKKQANKTTVATTTDHATKEGRVEKKKHTKKTSYNKIDLNSRRITVPETEAIKAQSHSDRRLFIKPGTLAALVRHYANQSAYERIKEETDHTDASLQKLDEVSRKELLKKYRSKLNKRAFDYLHDALEVMLGDFFIKSVIVRDTQFKKKRKVVKWETALSYLRVDSKVQPLLGAWIEHQVDLMDQDITKQIEFKAVGNLERLIKSTQKNIVKEKKKLEQQQQDEGIKKKKIINKKSADKESDEEEESDDVDTNNSTNNESQASTMF